MSTLYAVNKTKTLNPISDNVLAPGTLGGRVRVLTDVITLAAAQVADVIQIGRVLQKGAIILGIDVQWAALGAGSTLDVGDLNDDDRYVAAESTDAAGRLNEVLLAGLHYVVGTAANDGQIILTVGGAAATGQVNITVYYTED